MARITESGFGPSVVNPILGGDTYDESCFAENDLAAHK
jgi:hypothetical protein